MCRVDQDQLEVVSNDSNLMKKPGVSPTYPQWVSIPTCTKSKFLNQENRFHK